MMKLFRLLTKKTRYHLKPKQRIITGKIDKQVISTIENNVITYENFKNLFYDIDETELVAILTDYRRKWEHLSQYLGINDFSKTYNDLLNLLITILDDFYYH